jgi:hypothetical protein
VQLSKSEAAALLDLLEGQARWLAKVNDRGERGPLLGCARRKISDALVRAMTLDAERAS